MKAITYEQYGPPDVLQLTDVEKPSPGDDEVLIRVQAAEATKADCEMRSFRFAVKWFWLPLRLAVGVTRPRRRKVRIRQGGFLNICSTPGFLVPNNLVPLRQRSLHTQPLTVV